MPRRLKFQLMDGRGKTALATRVGDAKVDVLCPRTRKLVYYVNLAQSNVLLFKVLREERGGNLTRMKKMRMG